MEEEKPSSAEKIQQSDETPKVTETIKEDEKENDIKK